MCERQKTAPQARGRRFCHVFEVAQSVYKYALNRLSFRAQPKNFVILSLSKNLVETKRQTFAAPVPDEVRRSIVACKNAINR